MNAVDTNVLIYVHDPRDPGKQATADALVKSLIDGVLLWQVACEFIAASRKLESYGFSREGASLELHRLQEIWTTKLPSWLVIQRAEDLQASYSLSFWDALIIAAWLEGGVSRLYSEGFTGQPRIEGLSLINPFAAP